jgi:hypothetical protein
VVACFVDNGGIVEMFLERGAAMTRATFGIF